MSQLIKNNLLANDIIAKRGVYANMTAAARMLLLNDIRAGRVNA